MSIALHGRLAQENTINIDTTVQGKSITYPTDAKLAIKIIAYSHPSRSLNTLDADHFSVKMSLRDRHE